MCAVRPACEYMCADLSIDVSPVPWEEILIAVECLCREDQDWLTGKRWSAYIPPKKCVPVGWIFLSVRWTQTQYKHSHSGWLDQTMASPRRLFLILVIRWFKVVRYLKCKVCSCVSIRVTVQFHWRIESEPKVSRECSRLQNCMLRDATVPVTKFEMFAHWIGFIPNIPTIA